MAHAYISRRKAHEPPPQFSIPGGESRVENSPIGVDLSNEGGYLASLLGTHESIVGIHSSSSGRRRFARISPPSRSLFRCSTTTKAFDTFRRRVSPFPMSIWRVHTRPQVNMFSASFDVRRLPLLTTWVHYVAHFYAPPKEHDKPPFADRSPADHVPFTYTVERFLWALSTYADYMQVYI